MNEATTTKKNAPPRVPITAFISEDTHSALLRIAAERDLSLSSIIRVACSEYAKKNTEN